jgi:hypothetical protein
LEPAVSRVIIRVITQEPSTREGLEVRPHLLGRKPFSNAMDAKKFRRD